MNRLRSLLRWILRGERNVTASLDSLSLDLRELQRRVDAFEPVASPRPLTTGVDPWPVASQPSAAGVNVVGYLQHQIGLGDIGRRMCDILEAGDISTSPIAFDATASPLLHRPFPATQRIDHARTIAVVAADQLPILHRDHPEIFAASDRIVGYCFWELSTLSAAGAQGARLVDEIWAPTTFIAAAFEHLGEVEVRHVPLTVAEPRPSARTRDSFPVLSDAGDRLVVGVTLDHFSVLERKNPIGAIDAFRRAFASQSDALLVVKTLNADQHPGQDGRLRAAAQGRSDIVVWDEHLDRPDQLAFISHLDVLVSMHRGEGLGLHLAEAMWLGVPVVATGYSGNLDFMDETCARLVSHTMVPVADGGNIYPPGAEWAEPDIGEAAEILMTLASSPELCVSIGRAGRERMGTQPSDPEVAATVAASLGISVP